MASYSTALAKLRGGLTALRPSVGRGRLAALKGATLAVTRRHAIVSIIFLLATIPAHGGDPASQPADRADQIKTASWMRWRVLPPQMTDATVTIAFTYWIGSSPWMSPSQAGSSESNPSVPPDVCRRALSAPPPAGEEDTRVRSAFHGLRGRPAHETCGESLVSGAWMLMVVGPATRARDHPAGQLAVFFSRGRRKNPPNPCI